MRRLSIAFLCAIAVAPSPARAGNDDAVLLGNEAAMTGGAVVAVTSDGSATWYNPAGLGHVQRDTVDVSASIIMLRVGLAPGLLRTAVGDQADGSYESLVNIPSAVTYVRPLGDGVNLGIGLFSPRYDNQQYRLALEENGAGYTGDWHLTTEGERTDYHLGVAVGFSPIPRLRFGVGLFITYRDWSLLTGFSGAITRDDGTVGFAASRFVLASLSAIGAELSAGVQWEIVDRLHVGLAIRSPGAVFLTSYEVAAASLDATATADAFAASLGGASFEPTFELVTPTRIHLSVAYRLDGGWIGAEADIQHPLSSPNVDVEREIVWNVRAGGRFTVDPKVSVGLGAFTDNGPRRNPRFFGDTAIDFYGITVGLELRNPHRLGEDEPVEDFEFVSTFALRYAVGVGRIGGLSIDSTAGNGAVTLSTVETIVQEIGLHIGSALYF